MGMPKSWRSSSVCKTDGYAFGGSNPPIPTTYSDIAQLVEQFIRNEPVARSSRAVGANMVSVAQLVEPRFVEPAVASSSLVGYPILPISQVGKADASEASYRSFESSIGN